MRYRATKCIKLVLSALQYTWGISTEVEQNNKSVGRRVVPAAPASPPLQTFGREKYVFEKIVRNHLVKIAFFHNFTVTLLCIKMCVRDVN